MKRQHVVILLILAVLAGALVVLPPERRLGRLLVLIYLHGALVRTAVVFFLAAAVAGGLALARSRTSLFRWSEALYLTAVSSWTLGFVLSFYPSYAAWGTFIAWSEPRTQMAMRVLLLSLLFLIVARWVADLHWLGIVHLLMGFLVPVLVARTGVVLHPLDPIGTSPSVTLRTIYLVVLACTLALGVFLSRWWYRRPFLLSVHLQTVEGGRFT